VLGLGQSRTADLFAHAVPARSRLVDGHDPGHVQPSKTSGPGFPKTNLIRLARYTRPRCHRGFISSPRSALSNFRSPRRKIISAPRQCVGVLNDGHCTCQTRGGTTRRPPCTPPQPNFQVTPTRPTLLFRQIPWQDQNEGPLSKVRSNLSGRSTAEPESKLIQAPSVFRLSTVQARPADASFTMILPG
jgi:hypothetical protein